MKNLFDVYVAYLEKRNIFQEVKEFQKNDSDSQSLQSIIEWLWEIVDLSEYACQN